MLSFEWIINDVPAGFLREQQANGLRRLYRPTDKEAAMLEDTLAQARVLFEEEITSPLHAPIVAVYMFDSDECSDDFGEADAMCSRSSAGLDFDYYCLGFSRRAFPQGAGYVQFLVLHELAHALAWRDGHGPHYEATLDMLLLRFNHATGKALKNDYLTFNGEGEQPQ